MLLEENRETMGVASIQGTDDTKKAWDRYHFEWTWRAVECLVELEEFESSAKWIANRLNISLDEAVDALEGLEKIKRISKNSDGKYIACKEFINSTNEYEFSELAKFQVLMSGQIASQIKSPSTSKFVNTFLATNIDLLKDYFNKSDALFMDLVEKSKNCTPDSVYARVNTWVNVTPKKMKEDLQ